MLSIVITNYKTPELLKLCLNSIKKNCSDIDYGTIVIDIESEGSELEEYYPETKFIFLKENSGYSKAVNRGIKESVGGYIFIINSDIVLKKDSVQELVRFMEENKNVAVVGPRLINFNNKTQFSCFRFYTPLTILCRRTFLGGFGGCKKLIDKFLMKKEIAELSGKDDYIYADWLMGSALMVRRSALDKVGLMDERFFMYFEDVDWCRRFWENGYEVAYHPKSEIYHYHMKESRGGILNVFTNKMTRVHLLSAVKYFWKWRNGLNLKNNKSL